MAARAKSPENAPSNGTILSAATAKVCQSKPNSGLQQKDKWKDRARVAKMERPERSESDKEEAIIQEERAVRANTNTLALIL